MATKKSDSKKKGDKEKDPEKKLNVRLVERHLRIGRLNNALTASKSMLLTLTTNPR